jgi:hypothetical protein
MLAKKDAHGVYEKAGFDALIHPEWYMQRLEKMYQIERLHETNF